MPPAAPPRSPLEAAVLELLRQVRPRVRDPAWQRWAVRYWRGRREAPAAFRQMDRLRERIDAGDEVPLADPEAEQARRLARAAHAVAGLAFAVATNDVGLVRSAVDVVFLCLRD